MGADWKLYQEEAATFFRELGLDAKTDVAVKGVRTAHDVDVLVQSHYAGFDVTWIVECKLWKAKVSKLHVLALREIVADVGADRGILLSESGYQSGAFEAAALTNVHITSLEQLRMTARNDIFAMRLHELYDRAELCKKRYWDIPKATRIEYGLRPDVSAPGYSGTLVLNLMDDLLRKAFRGNFPIELDEMAALAAPKVPPRIISVESCVAMLESLIAELEGKLDACEREVKPPS